MKRKFFSLFLCSMVLVGSVCGCGNNAPPTASSNGAANVTESTVTSEITNKMKEDVSKSTVDGLTEDHIALKINDITLKFPFRVEELSDDFVLTPKMYIESENYTLCDLSSVNNTKICTVFVEGKESDYKDSKIIGIVVDDMNDNISFRGLNNDTMASYIEQYGEPNDQSDNIIEYTWGSINFLIMFDNISKEANYVNLLIINED